MQVYSDAESLRRVSKAAIRALKQREKRRKSRTAETADGEAGVIEEVEDLSKADTAVEVDTCSSSSSIVFVIVHLVRHRPLSCSPLFSSR